MNLYVLNIKHNKIVNKDEIIKISNRILFKLKADSRYTGPEFRKDPKKNEIRNFN